MPNFSRAFRNMVKLFPGAGNWQGPSAVSNVVAFVEQFSRPGVTNEINFRNDFQTAATGGAATTLTHAEPPSGYIHVPILWSVTYDGVANISCQAQLVRSANPVDPWGGWYGNAAGTRAPIGTYRVGSVTAAPEGILVQAFPYMRGFQLGLNFPAPAAATNVNASLYFVEMPIELASIDTWKAMPGNFNWNRPEA